MSDEQYFKLVEKLTTLSFILGKLDSQQWQLSLALQDKMLEDCGLQDHANHTPEDLEWCQPCKLIKRSKELSEEVALTLYS
jgi:hypothetical protein